MGLYKLDKNLIADKPIMKYTCTYISRSTDVECSTEVHSHCTDCIGLLARFLKKKLTKFANFDILVLI